VGRVLNHNVISSYEHGDWLIGGIDLNPLKWGPEFFEAKMRIIKYSLRRLMDGSLDKGPQNKTINV